jgi:hypothetical protein
MKTRLLFPNRCKKIGWILLLPSAAIGILIMFFDFKLEFLDAKVFGIIYSEFPNPTSFFSFTKNNLTDEIIGTLFIIGALLVAFSKEKYEDEFIARVRIESLVWATYVSYFILIFCLLFVYGTEFFTVMVFNMFTILVFFIIRFYYALYKSKKSLSDEK